MGIQRFRPREDETSLSDQIHGWEQDELKKMEQERLEPFGTRRPLDHLKWNATEQEVQDGSSGSDQAVDRNDHDGSDGDQVLLGTGERTLGIEGWFAAVERL
jgi:hypothetical protein